jgi:2-polyprenyl-6-hydroxyphenyl methylase/3-demethylubiquinone-9 3-methyltransferase
MTDPTSHPRPATLDTEEVARFGAQADDWWNPRGNFAPLHKLGPARLTYIRDEAVKHFSLPTDPRSPLIGLTALDIGCGGGLVAEPLARLGATITAIDPAPENIAAARHHMISQGLAIDYRATTVEQLSATAQQFDLVVCLEVVEHVPDVPGFLATCANLVRPGGLMVLSTLNRTLKSYALAIVGAEYVLRWLPRGTHRWDRFVTPAELASSLRAAGLQPDSPRGLVYRPLVDTWDLAPDTGVNYFLTASRPA